MDLIFSRWIERAWSLVKMPTVNTMSLDPTAARRSAAGFMPSRPRHLRRTAWILLGLLGGYPHAASPGLAQSGSLISREEALESVYPGRRFEAERIFLTVEEMKKAAALAGAPISSALVARYQVWEEDSPMGRAYVDTHVVRTKKESLLICLNADGSVRRIEVTAFQEPPEYQAPPAWYRQFEQRGLGDSLLLNRGIRPVAGATLTAVATERAVRRVLAIDGVVAKRMP